MADCFSEPAWAGIAKGAARKAADVLRASAYRQYSNIKTTQYHAVYQQHVPVATQTTRKETKLYEDGI